MSEDARPPQIKLSNGMGEKGQLSTFDNDIELKAGWNDPVYLKANKTMLFWNRVIFTAMGVLLLPAGIYMLFTDETALGILSIVSGFLGFFALGGVEFAIRFRRARGTTIDIKDIERERLLHLLDGFLWRNGIEHIPAEEDYLLLRGTGFEIPRFELRLLTFPMRVTKYLEPGVFVYEHKYQMKNMRVMRLGIRNVDRSNFNHAVQIQILLDRFLLSHGITGIPNYYDRKVGYTWNGNTYVSVYD